MVISTGWEYAGPMAATHVGVPFVLHGWGLLADPELDVPVAEALEPLHGQWGLDRVREPWRLIDNCPRSLPWATPPATAIHSKYAAYNGSGVLPS
jgi:EryCIII-like glycosyltransferase